MMNFRRMLRGLTVFGSLAAMAQANTISYYVELFVPGETTNNLSGQNLSGAFTNAQLLGFASGVALHDASVEGFSGTVTLPQFNQLTAPGVGANQMGVLSSVQMVIAWAAKGTIAVLNYNAAGISFSSANSLMVASMKKRPSSPCRSRLLSTSDCKTSSSAEQTASAASSAKLPANTANCANNRCSWTVRSS